MESEPLTDCMNMKLPKEIFSQHIAVLGKTGSGKTSTAKLLIEQAVAEDSRVCVLDPIKSDWWGLTSSASGKRGGLPFQILGGPHGHVPLHASAGKAVAEIVANGALPLSIIDMADFEPGGQAKFFVDFAPKLLQKMRGFIYLVIEEAHLFAPKERSGIGQENMAIHWAKTLATAGRSKGVRLILVSHRVQALHNALLGSCETLIAHRLTAPADQTPVIKWLNANAPKDVAKKIEGSLASQKTGNGWVCSGEAKFFELVHFPRISTYDNTATPTGDSGRHKVKMAAVDTDKLLSIISEAVEEAKANDPKELKKQLADKDREIAKLKREHDSKAPVVDEKATERAVNAAIIERDRKWQKVLAEWQLAHAAIAKRMQSAKPLAEKLLAAVTLNGEATVSVAQPADIPAYKTRTIGQAAPQVERRQPIPPRGEPQHVGDVKIGKPELNTLRALYWTKDDKSVDTRKLCFLAGYSPAASTLPAALTALRKAGLVDGRNLTAEGMELIASKVGPKPSGPELREWIRSKVGKIENSVLDVLMSDPNRSFTVSEVCELTGYSSQASTVPAAMTKLRKYEAIEGGGREGVRAAEVFFE
jgi:hypothetical protein